MNNPAEQYQRCLEQAKKIVASYRAEAPEGCDPQNTFAAVAVVGGVAAVGAAGYSAYNSNKAAGAASANAAQLQGNVANAMRFVPNVKPVNFSQYQLNGTDTSFQQYLGQASDLGSLTSFANQQNSAWQGILNRASPGYTASVKAAGNVVNQRVLGNLTAADQSNVARSSAYQALQGGFGATSASGHALTARDLGTTTDAIQTQGMSELPGQGQLAANLSPVNPANLMFSPQTLMARNDSNVIGNNQITNSGLAFNASLSEENQNAKFQALLNQAGIQYQSNNLSNTAAQQAGQATASAIGSIGSAALGAGIGANGGTTGMGMGGINWGQVGGMLSGNGMPTAAQTQTNPSGMYSNGLYSSPANAINATGNTNAGFVPGINGGYYGMG